MAVLLMYPANLQAECRERLRQNFGQKRPASADAEILRIAAPNACGLELGGFHLHRRRLLPLLQFVTPRMPDHLRSSGFQNSSPPPQTILRAGSEPQAMYCLDIP